MALWHIDFFVIPEKSFDSDINLKLSDDGFFDDWLFWKKQSVHIDLFDPLSEILPKTKSWSNSIVMFGDENSNRLNVLHENEVVESVSFRIDFRTDYAGVLNGLLTFFIQNQLIILDEKLNVIPLRFQVISDIIQNSPQIKKYRMLSGNG